MPAKGTAETFVEMARAKHGNVYDYSKVEYVNNRTKVLVVCSLHGEFVITPSNHIRGQGCRTCGRKRNADGQRKSTEQFVAEARAIHGDKYDYSRSEYQQARAKLEIVCPKHGPFQQEPWSHLSGCGCPKCGFEETADKHRLDPSQFLVRARERFGARFDYSRTGYETAWTPIEIGCPVHGTFLQTPVGHLAATHGCPKCANLENKGNAEALKASNNARKVKTAEFIERAVKAHGNKYDYSKAECTSSKSKVSIICPTHGTFWQLAGEHMAGQGCRKCANITIGDKQRQSPEDFLQRAMHIHGDKYDYSQMLYVTALAPIIIRCPVHGEFQQTPHTHLKSGCRKCADNDLPGAYSLKVLSRDPTLATRPALLYYLLFESDSGEHFYKIGITLKSIKQRFAGYGAAGYSFTVLGKKEMELMDAFKAEQTLVTAHVKKHHYTPLRGNRERTTKFGEPILNFV